MLRAIFSTPLGLFNQYSALVKSKPREMNLFTLFFAYFFVTIAGKGAERFHMRSYLMRGQSALQQLKL